MTKRGVIKLVSIAAGIAVVCVAKHIYDKGTKSSLNDIRNRRSDSDNKLFDEYDAVCTKTEAILTREMIDEKSQRAAIESAYNAADKKVQDILAKERAIAQEEYRLASENLGIYEVMAKAIEDKEEKLISDILKTDDAYTALQYTYETLKEAEKPTKKVKKKMKNREKTIRQGIIAGRSENDRGIFEEVDRLRQNMVNVSAREAAIVANRSDTEKLAFKDLERCRLRLQTIGGLKSDIKSCRSDEENAVFERQKELIGLISEIEEREQMSVDKTQAFADQLKSMGFSKFGVFIFGIVPTIPVGLLIADYISWLFRLTKKM